MKKKIIGVVSALVLVVILATCLAACNPYKWNGIGGGDASADVVSNGGYVVKQGNYLYYINGYEGTGGENNEWGTPVKQSIVRSEIREDGTIDNASTKVVVPKIIYNSSAKGGFAIYGEWIYYATPNNDRDKTGTASTTDTDFMRTKIDASVTQRLGKINVRNAEYLFTPTRVLYYSSNKINYIDFSGMKTDKNIDNAKGAKDGELVEDQVSSVAWNMNSDTIYYTRTVTGENSYKNYNELCSVKVDGSDQKVLATENTFVSEGGQPQNEPQNVFKYTLRDMYLEEDNSTTLYYTATYYLNDTDNMAGLYMAKASDIKGTRKQLNTIGSYTLYALGYNEGALAYNSASVYCLYDGTLATAQNPVQVTDTSQTVWFVDQKAGLAYITKSSSASELTAVSYKTPGNMTSIISEGIKVDWLRLDFVVDGDQLYFYFFATNDSNLMHMINVKTFDKEAEDEEGNKAESTYVGFEKEEDEEEDK